MIANGRLASPRPDDDRRRLIDLLVDGELDEPQRRHLLERLNAEPDGWRDCALAFLESQTWGQAFGPVSPCASLISRPSATPTPAAEPAAMLPFAEPEPKPRGRRVRVRARGWGWRLGLAASALATAFAAGLVAGELRRPSSPPSAPSPEIAASEPSPAPANREVRPVSMPSSELVYVPGAHPVDVPLDERWLRDPRVAVSHQEREHLRRMGYEVSETKRLISITLANGQRVSIPLGEVKLKFVGLEYH